MRWDQGLSDQDGTILSGIWKQETSQEASLQARAQRDVFKSIFIFSSVSLEPKPVYFRKVFTGDYILIFRKFTPNSKPPTKTKNEFWLGILRFPGAS